MSNSILTNVGAQIALQSLNYTQSQLQSTQKRISTGLKVASAADNAAIWGIAETTRAQISSLGVVTDSLNNASAIADTTLNAGQQLADLAKSLRTKALAASDLGIDDTARQKFQDEFVSLAQSYANVIATATFNGTNLLDNNSTGQISAIGNADATIHITAAHDSINAAKLFSNVLSITAGTVPASGTVDIPDSVSGIKAGAEFTGANGASHASSAVGEIDKALKSVTSALSSFGTAKAALTNQITLVAKLTDSLTAGVGNLVDADLAKESANLQALQTQQQLGVQALGIANNAPQILLGLFR